MIQTKCLLYGTVKILASELNLDVTILSHEFINSDIFYKVIDEFAKDQKELTHLLASTFIGVARTVNLKTGVEYHVADASSKYDLKDL